MRRFNLRSRTATIMVTIAVALSCAASASALPRKAAATTLILASTTSTQDSGLFAVLIPAFMKAYPDQNVQVVAVGSGEALTIGQNKDADVCLVHSPASEVSFMASGYGIDRRPVCYNDFIIVGPNNDPAHIQGDTSAIDAFQRISTAQATFVSRGDSSGTYSKEVSLWASATVSPKGQPWYFSSGQGMGATLLMSEQKLGYTLADRATWMVYAAKTPAVVPDLKLLVEGDPVLYNPYHIIRIPGARNMDGALKFENWMTSPAGQKVIGDFGVAQFGRQIFVPDASQVGRLSKSPQGASYTIARRAGSARFTYSATLQTSAGAGIPGKTILLQKSADGVNFTTVKGASMVADANGTVTVNLVFKTPGTGIWRWMFAGDSAWVGDTHLAATSTSKSRITVK